LYCTTSGQEAERVYSYNPGSRTGAIKIESDSARPPTSSDQNQTCMWVACSM